MDLLEVILCGEYLFVPLGSKAGEREDPCGEVAKLMVYFLNPIGFASYRMSYFVHSLAYRNLCI